MIEHTVLDDEVGAIERSVSSYIAYRAIQLGSDVSRGYFFGFIPQLMYSSVLWLVSSLIWMIPPWQNSLPSVPPDHKVPDGEADRDDSCNSSYYASNYGSCV